LFLWAGARAPWSGAIAQVPRDPGRYAENRKPRVCGQGVRRRAAGEVGPAMDQPPVIQRRSQVEAIRTTQCRAGTAPTRKCIQMIRRTNQSGFTLIELMIVVAIIAIIAAIAIPRLMSARLSANESAAISTLRSVSSAQA